MVNLLRRRALSAGGADYIEEFTAPWLISGSDARIQYNFSNTETAVNYPSNITDYPSCLHFISKRTASTAPGSINNGANPPSLARFCTRTSGYTAKYYGFLTSSGVLKVDGFYYSYLKISKSNFDAAVNSFTTDIAGGQVSYNSAARGAIAMWRNDSDILDKWVIESDTLNADIIRRLKPHT